MSGMVCWGVARHGGQWRGVVGYGLVLSGLARSGAFRCGMELLCSV